MELLRGRILRVFLFYISYFTICNALSFQNDNNAAVNSFLTALDAHSEFFHSLRKEDYIVVIGNAPSGKSRLIRFLTNDDLTEYDHMHDDGFQGGSDDGRYGRAITPSYFDYPHLVTDQNSGEIFIDLTAYSTPRELSDMKFDILYKMVMRETFSNAINVKFILVIDHARVKEQSENSEDLIDLLEHTCRLITNVENYDFFLVFNNAQVDSPTEIDNEISISSKYILETYMKLNSAIKILESENLNLNESSPSAEDILGEITLKKNMVKLTEILLTQRGSEFIKLGISPGTYTSGFTRKTELITSTKLMLTKKLNNNNFQYRPTNIDYFKISITNASDNYIEHDIMPELESRIKEKITLMFESVKRCLYRFARTSKLKDDNIIEEMSRRLGVLSDFVTEEPTLNILIETLLSSIQLVDTQRDKQHIIDTLGMVQHFKMLLRLSNGEVNVEYLIDRDVRDSVQTLYHETVDWVPVVTRTYEMFSKYYIQINFESLLSLFSESNSREVTAENVERFCKFVLVSGNCGLAKSPPGDFIIKLMNKIISDALQVEVTCRNGQLTVIGTYVIFSRLLEVDCVRPNLIRIFATERVFIDQDLQFFGHQVEVIIISPRWKMIDARTIALHIAAGASRQISTSINELQIFDQENVGSSGLSFFSVGEIFAGSLQVILNAPHSAEQNTCKSSNQILCHSYQDSPNSQRYPAIADSLKGTFIHLLDLSNVTQESAMHGESQNIARNIILYKKLVRKFLLDRRMSETTRDFIHRLHTHPLILRYFSLETVMEDIVDFVNDRDLWAEQFRSHIDLYVDTLRSIRVEPTKVFGLQKLSSILFGLKNHLSAKNDRYIIVKLKSFIEETSKTIGNIEKLDRIQIINAECNLYSAGINASIFEARSLIANGVEQEFNKLFSEFDNNIKDLTEETKQLQEDAEKHKKVLEIKEKLLQENIKNHIILGAAKAAASVISSFGPIGAAIGSASMTAIAVTESQVIKDVDVSNVEFEIPEGIDEPIQLLLGSEADDTVSFLETELEKVAEFPDITGALSEVTSHLANLKRYVEDKNNNPINDISQFCTKVRGVFRKKVEDVANTLTNSNLGTNATPMSNTGASNTQSSNTLSGSSSNSQATSSSGPNSRISSAANTAPSSVNTPGSNADIPKAETSVAPQQNKNRKRLATALKSMQVASAVADISMQAFNNVKGDEKKLNVVYQAMRNTDNSIQKLKRFESNIKKITGSVLGNTKNMLIELNESGKKSSASRVLEKWKLKEKLNDIKSAFRKFVKGFQVEARFMQIFTKLEELSNVVITIFDKIQSYEEQRSLGVYMAKIASPYFGKNNIADEGLRIAINELELLRDLQVIQDLSTRIEGAFKQQVFPFAQRFLGNYHKTSDVNLTLVQKTELAIESIKNVNVPLSKIESTIIGSYHTDIINTDFDSHTISRAPFFVWDKRTYTNEILRFLSGEEVWLQSDVIRKGIHNAVKFREIQINIKAKSRKMQEQIDKLLIHFELSMTHIGNNYYRCDNDYYMIKSNPVTIITSYEKKSSGNPTTYNEIETLLKNGDVTLSPYTTWGVKLISKSQHAFSKLRKYHSYVDLELVGKGQYYRNSAGRSNVCNEDLKSHYDVYDSVRNVYNYDSNEVEKLLN